MHMHPINWNAARQDFCGLYAIKRHLLLTIWSYQWVVITCQIYSLNIIQYHFQHQQQQTVTDSPDNRSANLSPNVRLPIEHIGSAVICEIAATSVNFQSFPVCYYSSTVSAYWFYVQMIFFIYIVYNAVFSASVVALMYIWQV